MAIFKFTLIKYLKAPSTWIILVLSMFIAGFLGGYLPFHSNVAKGNSAASIYANNITMIVGTITSYLAIFVSIFAGFKASTMYKDEVEDGTFLLMLSKPQTRRRIIFQKWLALQAITLAYTFLTVLSFMIMIFIFDTGSEIRGLNQLGVKTISSNIVPIALLMWVILIVISLIFTSISLLISTKASVGTTVGLSIAIGVIIPLTAIVGMFTAKPAYVKIDSGAPDQILSSLKLHGQEFGDLANENKVNRTQDTFNIYGTSKKGREQEPSSSAMHHKQTNENNNIGAYPSSLKEASGIRDAIQALTKQMDEFSKYSLDLKTGLRGLGFATGETDAFRGAFITDLNYQINRLGSIASDISIPDGFKVAGDTSKNSQMSGDPQTVVVTKEDIFNPGDVEKQLLERMTNQAVKSMEIGLDARRILHDKGIVDWNFVLTPNVNQFFTDRGSVHEIKRTMSMFKDMISSPISFSISNSKLASSWHDKKYAYDNVNRVRTNMYKDIMARIKADDAGTDRFFLSGKDLVRLSNGTRRFVQNPTNSFNNTEVAVENRLLQLAHYADTSHKRMFVGVRKTPYANKYYILWVYLAFAIILVPTSYFVVRKQDFR